MNDEASPVAAQGNSAARRKADVETDANIHVQVGAPTRRMHLWQQIPAWLLGFAAIGLGFLMVLRNYDSSAGWFAVSTGVLFAVLASFRAPFSIGETALSTAPGKRRKKPTTPANPPSGG
jgi:hypothetical protein